MDTIKKLFAQKLMDIKAIKLQPNEPFTWASGWKSPIYTDNRKTLGFADVRSFVKLELCHAIQENFPEAEAVAGVATGAIAQGALVSLPVPLHRVLWLPTNWACPMLTCVRSPRIMVWAIRWKAS